MKHIAVWLDHNEARLFHVDAAATEAVTIHAPNRHVHRHETHTADTEHPSDALHYFQQISHALIDADPILIVGPATAKQELVHHLHRHEPALEKKIAGVETVDHPTARQIVAFAKTFFAREDRMRP